MYSAELRSGNRDNGRESHDFLYGAKNYPCQSIRMKSLTLDSYPRQRRRHCHKKGEMSLPVSESNYHFSSYSLGRFPFITVSIFPVVLTPG